MKVLLKQFLGKNHSWSVCGWGIAQGLLDCGHSVDLFSTDGIKNLPKNLLQNVIGYTEENDNLVVGKMPGQDYDCQISYTCMKNFTNYLSHGNKNRVGIWCYEWAGKNVLPTGFAKHYKSCDFIAAPTNFAKSVFLDSGVPESSVKVIPHGINSTNYKQKSKTILNTNKKFKILANIAQNHLRKNIPAMLEAYGKAFTKKDDVCLIIKGKEKKITQQFEVSLTSCLLQFKEKFPDHADTLIYTEFIDDISELYRSIDCVFTLTHCEGFFFPGLESIASGKLVIAPNWGGQIDFLNESNSLLVSGKETRANPKSMYWESKPNAIWFQPNIDDAVDKLRFAYNNFEKLNRKVCANMSYIHDQYDWKNISKLLLNECK